jgi:Fic-DOC domain mobile mystery protein B
MGSIKFDLPEGATVIDPNEAVGLIPALSTQAELNEFEALNIAEAMDWAERSRQIRNGLLDRETLRLLHKRMFDKTWKWAGKYRQTQKSIGVEAWRISTEIENLLNDVKCWRDYATYEPDEICVRFHHRLVSIHPFPNGNGRHARLAADLLVKTLGREPFSWGSGNLVASTDIRRQYIAALRCADQHDISPLIQFSRG